MSADMGAEANVWHVYPEGDAQPHVTDGRPCWCNPTSEPIFGDYGTAPIGRIVTHTAADGRTNQARPFLHGAN